MPTAKVIRHVKPVTLRAKIMEAYRKQQTAQKKRKKSKKKR